MIRVIRSLVLAVVLGCAATDAAAQPVGGAPGVQAGTWEYRWRTTRDQQGNVTRDTSGGTLRLEADLTYALERRVGGVWTRGAGSFQVEGPMLYLPRAGAASGGPAARDTFLARRIGDRLFLHHQDGDVWVEYTLARSGGPDEPRQLPGIIPSIYGFLWGIAFFETGEEIPPYEERNLTNTFRADSARFINAQFEFHHPIALADHQLALACTITDPAGAELISNEWTTPVARGDIATRPSQGWGSDVPGGWRPGLYRVRCTADGVPLPLAAFTIQ
jgi:hypothetical protein